MGSCVEIILGPSTAVLSRPAVNAPQICRRFQVPVEISDVGYTLQGGGFRMFYLTNVPCECKYRERQVISGVPGAWSEYQDFWDGDHVEDQTVHTEPEHKMTQKGTLQVWDYQLQITGYPDPVPPTIYPSPTKTIRVIYPNKFGGGGGFDADNPIGE
jgi:hypothetical protein